MAAEQHDLGVHHAVGPGHDGLAAVPRRGRQAVGAFGDHDGLVDVTHLDHVVCHYSTNAFRDLAFDGLRRRIPTLDTERWFSNLETRGNTGAASIFIALEEAWRTGRFAPGETVLLAVPESGRFSFAFAHLTVVAPPDQQGAPR